MVKSLGAAAAFDYNDPECARNIKEYTNNSIKYVWDTIGAPNGVKICAEVISPGGSYGTIAHSQISVKNVRNTKNLAYKALGYTVAENPIEKPFEEERIAKDVDFMKKWIEVVDSLLQQKQLKVHPPAVVGGLEDVLDGLSLMRQGKVSGKKLVYTV